MVRKLQSYEELEGYQLAKILAIEIHRITLHELPKFEMYEEGSQIRHSSKSIGLISLKDLEGKNTKGNM